MVAGEDPSDVGMVVEADDGLALELAQDLGHLLVLLDAKSDGIALSLPVRRVHVEQRVCPVVATECVSAGPA